MTRCRFMGEVLMNSGVYFNVKAICSSLTTIYQICWLCSEGNSLRRVVKVREKMPGVFMLGVFMAHAFVSQQRGGSARNRRRCIWAFLASSAATQLQMCNCDRSSADAAAVLDQNGSICQRGRPSPRPGPEPESGGCAELPSAELRAARGKSSVRNRR